MQCKLVPATPLWCFVSTDDPLCGLWRSLVVEVDRLLPVVALVSLVTHLDTDLGSHWPFQVVIILARHEINKHRDMGPLPVGCPVGIDDKTHFVPSYVGVERRSSPSFIATLSSLKVGEKHVCWSYETVETTFE